MSLWDQAYIALRKEDEGLIVAYEKFLLASRFSQDHHERDETGNKTSTDTQTTPAENDTGGVLRQEQLKELVDLKIRTVEAARLRIPIGKRTLVVREQIDKVVCAIQYIKDFIQPITSAEPHAAIAWAGVSVLLSLLLNAVKQDNAAIEGLALFLTFFSDVKPERIYIQKWTSLILSGNIKGMPLLTVSEHQLIIIFSPVMRVRRSLFLI
ncbi:hypothetical protein M432DRAFT_110046 [Thermoascus aurantiacus ATCC 26904]